MCCDVELFDDDVIRLTDDDVLAAYPDSVNGAGGYPGYPSQGLPGGVHSTTVEPGYPAVVHPPVAPHVPHSTHSDANNHLPKAENSEVH